MNNFWHFLIYKRSFIRIIFTIIYIYFQMFFGKQVKLPSHLRAFAKNQNEKVHRLRETSKEEITQQLGAIDIFTDPACRKATLIMFVIWNSTNLGMQRITLSKVSLEFNNRCVKVEITNTRTIFYHVSCSIFWNCDECHKSKLQRIPCIHFISSSRNSIIG